LESGAVQQHYIQCGTRQTLLTKVKQAHLPGAVVGLWLRERDPDPQDRVCANRVPVSVRDKREAVPGDHPPTHEILIRFNPIRSGSVARASNPEFRD
jgi:hypothetical protein